MLSGHRFRRDRASFIRGKRRRASPLLAFALSTVIPLARSEAAHAQEKVAPRAEISPPKPKRAMARVLVVDTFAELLGEPVENVAFRLHYNPRLVPLATKAAEARWRRQEIGKEMMTLGFISIGLGATLDFVAMVSAFGPPGTCGDRSCPDHPMGGEAKVVAWVGLGAMGLGLLLAIPGMIIKARQTDIETEAVNAYRASEADRPPVSPAGGLSSLLSGPGKKGLSLSLLSFTF